MYNVENQSNKFILDILDGMYDWVRVVDKENNVIYINQSMEIAMGDMDLAGLKCYEMLGNDRSCEICLARRAAFEGKTFSKEELFGDRIFDLMCSPIRDDNGEILYVVEVLRDITQDKEMERRILAQNRRMRDELQMAKRIQQELLPSKKEKLGIGYAYTYRPCSTLGGDFFNIFKMSKTRIGFYIADVSGHGASASMLTMFLSTTLSKRIISPARSLTQLYNDFNAMHFGRERYITILYGVIDLEERTLTYCNAGHNCEPLIVGKNKTKILYMPGLPICSWTEKPDYVDNVYHFSKGDRIMVYTDGLLSHNEKEDKDILQDKDLIKIIRSSRKNRLEESINMIEKHFLGPKSGREDELKDDFTLALIQPL